MRASDRSVYYWRFGVPYRVDQNGNGGGIILFLREDIPSKLPPVGTSATEDFFAEINLRKKKWLFICSYNPNRENIENHLETWSKNLALYSCSCENLIIIGDFNLSVEETSISGFCDTFGLKSLIKDATCYKNPEKSSSIDLILTIIHVVFKKLLCYWDRFIGFPQSGSNCHENFWKVKTKCYKL